MLPDMICIGIILFLIFAMLVSSYDSTKLRFADRFGFIFGIKRKHNESCRDLRVRIKLYREEQIGMYAVDGGWANAIAAATSFRRAVERFNEGTKCR